MKKVIYTFAPILLATLLISCASKTVGSKEASEQKVETVEKTEIEKPKTVEPAEKEAVQSKYNYDKDWEIIKTQIVAKNQSEVSDWIRGSKLSAEDVLMIFSDPNVLKALKNTSYKDLKTETIDGEVYLKFYYEETAINEDGDEVGMSVTMYMFQGDPNFQIDDILAAG